MTYLLVPSKSPVQEEDLEGFVRNTVFGRTEVANDNPATPRYTGICPWCKNKQSSHDPDTLCVECGEPVDYELSAPSVS